MWAWVLITGAGKFLGGLFKGVPWQVWVCIAVAVWAWRYHAQAVDAAADAGYKAGYEEADTKWVKAEQAQAIATQVAYMQREARMWQRLVLSYKAADQRVTAITRKAATLQEQLNAIRTADPPDPLCRLSDERVRWANCALGYTYACTGLR